MKKFVKTIACILLALSFAGVPSGLMKEDSSAVTTVSANSGTVYVYRGLSYGRPDSKGEYYIWKLYTVYSYGQKKPDFYEYIGTGKI